MLALQPRFFCIFRFLVPFSGRSVASLNMRRSMGLCKSRSPSDRALHVYLSLPGARARVRNCSGPCRPGKDGIVRVASIAEVAAGCSESALLAADGLS